MVEPLLVSNNLDCNRPSCSMVSATQHLTKGPLPKATRNLVAIAEMVMVNDKVVAAVVVVAVVVRWFVRMRKFLLAAGPDVIHRRVIKDLLPLVIRQILSLAALEDGYKSSVRERHNKMRTDRTYWKGSGEVPVAKAPGNVAVRPIPPGLLRAPTFSAAAA
jgi:hypothetical protein